MKKISKKKFCKCLELTRQFWETGDGELVQKRIDVAKTIGTIDWYPVVNLLDALLQNNGFLPEASDYHIISLLGVMGWEVVEDGEVDHAE